MRLHSAMACRFSVERLTDAHMWTFTLAERIPPKQAASMWGDLQRSLVRLGMHGIRVFEPHPGGHGLHVHLVCSGFHDVATVRHLASHYGWGRIDVQRVSQDGAEYVAKYLTKARRSDDWKGIRLWASFGAKKTSAWQPSRVKDMEYQHETGDLYRRLANVLQPGGRADRLALARKAYLISHGFYRIQWLPPVEYPSWATGARCKEATTPRLKLIPVGVQ